MDGTLVKKQMDDGTYILGKATSPNNKNISIFEALDKNSVAQHTSFKDELKSYAYGVIGGGSRFSSECKELFNEAGEWLLGSDYRPGGEGGKTVRELIEEDRAAEQKAYNELREKAPCKSQFDDASDATEFNLNVIATYENVKGAYSAVKSAKAFVKGKYNKFRGSRGIEPVKIDFTGEGEVALSKSQEKVTVPKEAEGNFKSLEQIQQEQRTKITNKSSSEMSIETNSSVGSTGSTGRTSSQSVVAKSATGGGCFLCDILVYTENGYKKIKDIKAGDKVYSKNIEADVKELNTVTRAFKNETLYIVHIKVNNEEICCTLEHPFWIVNRGWAAAKDIQAGDIIETYYGEDAYVSEILIDELTESIEIYNIEVEEASTYYVSELNLLVHNGCSASEEGIHNNPESTSYSPENIKTKGQTSEVKIKNSESAVNTTSQRTTDNIIQPNQTQIAEVNKVKDIKNDLKNSEHPHDYTRPGNYGEMKVDIDLESTGHYERINNERVTSLDDPTHHGIDHVFKNHTPPPDYVIVDSKVLRADSAVNVNKAPSLNKTKSGRQLSDKWINKNIENAVDSKIAKQIKRDIKFNLGKTLRIAAKVDKNGVITYYKVNNEGKVIKKPDGSPEVWIP